MYLNLEGLSQNNPSCAERSFAMFATALLSIWTHAVNNSAMVPKLCYYGNFTYIYVYIPQSF